MCQVVPKNPPQSSFLLRFYNNHNNWSISLHWNPAANRKAAGNAERLGEACSGNEVLGGRRKDFELVEHNSQQSKWGTEEWTRKNKVFDIEETFEIGALDFILVLSLKEQERKGKKLLVRGRLPTEHASGEEISHASFSSCQRKKLTS